MTDPAARILVMDDQSVNLALIRATLIKAGYSAPTTLEDPREFMTTFVGQRPDLVILDLQMPHVDGLTLLDEIKATTSKGEYLPVLVLTADASSEARDQALSRGAHDFLTKPFDRTELLLRTANLLATRRLHQQVRAHNADLEAKVSARRAELARFKEIFDVLHEPVVMHADSTLEVIYSNAEARRLSYGCQDGSRPSEGGDGLQDLVLEAGARGVVDGELSDATFQAMIATGDDGQTPLDVRVQMIPGAGWNVLVVIARDRTTQNAAEDALRHALDREQEAGDRLRALDAMKGQFVMAVSHELRTPLTMVVGVTGMLADRRAELAAHLPTSMLDGLVRGVARLHQLVTDLNALAVAGLVDEGELQTVQLDELVRRTAVGSSVADRVDFDLEGVAARVDPDKVARIVARLLHNAGRYSPRSRPSMSRSRACMVGR